MKREEIQNIPDWEYEGEYYIKDNTKKKLSLEDFQTDSSPMDTDLDLEDGSTEPDSPLHQVVQEVTSIQSMMKSGKSIEEIAVVLSMEEARVRLVQMCMYGASEDANAIAIAHLVMMEDE